MSADQTSLPTGAEQVTRLAAEIERVLQFLIGNRIQIESHFGPASLEFASLVLHADRERRTLVIARSATEQSNQALLSRPRCTFVAAPSGAHLEFVAARPRQMPYEGAPAIALDFPEVLVYLKRRRSPRIELDPGRVAVHATLDAEGVLAFDGYLADISDTGVAIIYAPDITLESGTLLKGCRVALPRAQTLSFDVEVRYSQPVVLADGTPGRRSGCRFIGKAPDRELIERLIAARPEEGS